MARNTLRSVSADAGVREANCQEVWGPISRAGSPPTQPPTRGRCCPRPERAREDTVAEEREDDEVDGEDHAALDAALRLDAVVHDLVPVLARQDLRGRPRPGPGRPLSCLRPSVPRRRPRPRAARESCPWARERSLTPPLGHPLQHKCPQTLSSSPAKLTLTSWATPLGTWAQSYFPQPRPSTCTLALAQACHNLSTVPLTEPLALGGAEALWNPVRRRGLKGTC